MAVSIKPKFTKADIEKMMQAKLAIIEQAILNRLQFIGETFIANARNNLPKWKYIEANLAVKGQNVYYRNGKKYTRQAAGGEGFSDWTGNLRSSIGYIIQKNGKTVFSSFPGEHAEGKAQGQQVAKEAGAKFPNGYVIIVVSGMNYSAAVESKNYDVLTASSITAENDLKEAIAALKTKIGKMK